MNIILIKLLFFEINNIYFQQENYKNKIQLKKGDWKNNKRLNIKNISVKKIERNNYYYIVFWYK